MILDWYEGAQCVPKENNSPQCEWYDGSINPYGHCIFTVCVEVQ